MRKLPLVSIVTPSFNHGRFIQETIESVLSQNYSNIEYIIMDGGSNDNTLNILNKYSADARIRWQSKKDKGQTDAIKQGFEMSSGEILGWLNSDDFYLPNAISNMVNKLMESDSDFIYGDAIIVDENSRFLRYDVLPKHDNRLFQLFWGIHQPASFWTRDLYDSVGGLNLQYDCAMDRDLFCRMSKTSNFFKISSFLSAIRYHPKAKSTRYFANICYNEIVHINEQQYGRSSIIVPKAFKGYLQLPWFFQVLFRIGAAFINTPVRLIRAPKYTLDKLWKRFYWGIRSLPYGNKKI
jgi:glycosyltransferase involved in cell wall biosynthesis